MRRSVQVIHAALVLVATLAVATQPILGDGSDQQPIDVGPYLARWAAELGGTAMRAEPRRDERYLSAALADVGPAGFPTLGKLLLTGDHVAQRIALEALRDQGDGTPVPLLREAFFELDDPWARAQTLALLRRAGAAEALLADLVVQASKGPRQRRIAVENLALLGPPALPALEPFLDADHPDLASAAIDGIAGWGDQAARSVLLALQRAEDPRLHALAHGALGDFASAAERAGREVSELLDRAYRGSTTGGRDALLRWFALPVERRDRAATFVRYAAASTAPRRRQLAAAALEQSTDPRAESTLRSLLDDPAEAVRWQAAITLARLGDASGVPLVLEAMAAGYRVDPPSPTQRHCGTGLDPFAPAKSALVRLSGRLLEESAEGDVAVWRQWWREVEGSFDPVAAHLELLETPSERLERFGVVPSIPILVRRGDTATAARLIELGRERGELRFALDAALVGLGRRHGEVAALLAADLGDAGQPVAERTGRLRILGRIDPRIVERHLAAAGEAELIELLGADPTLISSPIAVERLIALLPESARARGAQSTAPSVYQLLDGLEGDRHCAELIAASAAETGPVDRLHAVQLVTRLGCEGARALAAAALEAPASGELAASFAYHLASFHNVADLPAMLGVLQAHDPEHRVRTIAIAVARVLGVRTGPGVLRALASADPLRRRGARFLAGTVLDRGWRHPISDRSGEYYLTVGELDHPAIAARRW